MSRPIREIESDLDDAIKARQAAEKAWDARVVMGNRWDEGWVRAQELDRLKTRVADLSGELRKAQQAALAAALAEPEPITEDALREGIDAQDRDLWQRRADDEFLKEYEKRYGKLEPATVECLLKWYMACDYRPLSNVWHYYCAGWRHAERFHSITKEVK